MKREGILHPQLSHLLASTGHTDYLTICDAGFPVPIGPERVDLALTRNIPTVLQVLKAIQLEFLIDRIIITREMDETSPDHVQALREIVDPEVEFEVVSHLELKHLAAGARGTIRTGDTTPYANIIIVSG